MFTHATIKATGGNAVTYHQQEFERGDRRFSVSSSMLREFARCPARWKRGYLPPETTAKNWGNILDTLLLTPELFASRYVVRPTEYTATVMVCPSCGSESDSKACRKCKVDREERKVTKPWNANASPCVQWIADNASREIITQKELADAQAARDTLKDDEHIAEFLKASTAQVWVEGVWDDPATGLTIPVRALLDLVPNKDSMFGKCLGDLKTTRSAAIIPFQGHVFQMGYHAQAAFHMDLYVAATGEERSDWCWLLSENYPPWQTGKRLCSQAFLEIGRAEYRKALALYCQCLERGEWPGYDDTDEAAQGWSVVQPAPWMESAAAFAPRFEIAPDTESAEADEQLDVIP